MQEILWGKIASNSSCLTCWELAIWVLCIEILFCETTYLIGPSLTQPYLLPALDLPALPYIKEPCMWESQCLDNDHLFPLSEKYPLYEQSCNFSTCQMFVHLSKYLSKLVGAYYLQTKGYPRERVLNKMILQRGHFRNGQTFGFHFILHVSIHQIF